MKYAPIVLFVYNRLEHTKKTVAALQSNKLANKSDLFIYSDFAKSESHAFAVANVSQSHAVDDEMYRSRDRNIVFNCPS